MADRDDEITLEQAAKLWKEGARYARDIDAELDAMERPANQPGAEATAVLETMLAASRKGKVVRSAG